MPKFVKVEANPAYKPKDAEDKAAFEAAKKAGAKELPYVTAGENIRNSGGMFRIAPDQPEVEARGPNLETMPIEDLKVMMLSLGIKTEKQMKRSDIVTLIRTKLDSVEIIDE